MPVKQFSVWHSLCLCRHQWYPRFLYLALGVFTSGKSGLRFKLWKQNCTFHTFIVFYPTIFNWRQHYRPQKIPVLECSMIYALQCCPYSLCCFFSSASKETKKKIAKSYVRDESSAVCSMFCHSGKNTFLYCHCTLIDWWRIFYLKP